MNLIHVFVSETAVNCCAGNKMCKDGKDTEKLEMQVELLNRLIDEMRDKNEVLKINNGLLLQRIQYLEEMGNVRKSVNKQPVRSGDETKDLLSSSSTSGLSQSTRREKQKSVNSTYSGIVQTSQASVGQEVRNVRMQRNNTGIRDNAVGAATGRLDDASNVGVVSRAGFGSTRSTEGRNGGVNTGSSNDVNNGSERQNSESQVHPHPSENDDRHLKDAEGFSIPRRQRHRMKKRLGTDKQECDGKGFTGGDRKVWLYIYRVKRHVVPQMIVDYIVKKPGFESLLVSARELPSDPDKLKCFVVTAPLKFKDEMYQGSFWPQNVGIKRFKFEKHREFLQSAGADFL